MKFETTFVSGDSHSNLTKIKQWNKSVENSVLIHAGDLGLGEWDLKNTSRKLNKNNNYLIAIAGNHEKKELFDGRIYNNSIELVKDYTVKEINGEKFLFIGGAISLDRAYRKQIKLEKPKIENWYRDNEAVYYDPIVETLTGIDVLITHTAPRKFIPNLDPLFLKRFTVDDPELITDLDKEDEVLTKIYNTVKANNDLKNLYFGHFHRYIFSEDHGTIIKCLDIDQIIEHNPKIYESIVKL
jgi:predicted phosphodiesterase